MGFQVSFDLQKGLTVSEHHTIVDDFITQAIEKNSLQFGGGGDIHWQGFIVLNKSCGSVSMQHRDIVQKWLENNPKIISIYVGELRDVWYNWNND